MWPGRAVRWAVVAIAMAVGFPGGGLGRGTLAWGQTGPDTRRGVTSPGDTVATQPGSDSPQPATRPVPPSTAAGAPTWPEPPAVQRDIRELAAQVADETLPQSRRDDAARRLVSRRSDGARRAAVAALVNVSDRGGQLAVARALAAEESPDPVYVTPLNALLGVDRSLTEAAAGALVNFAASSSAEVTDAGNGVGTNGGGVGGAGGGGGGIVSLLVQFVQSGGTGAGDEAGRVAVIRALGGLAEKRVARALVLIATDERESLAVRIAATDALGDLTGDHVSGHDFQRWAAWWEQMLPRPEEQVRLMLLTGQAVRGRLSQARFESLGDDLAGVLTDAYRQLPEGQETEKLLRLLRSSQPGLRDAAARIVYADAQENRTVAPAVRSMLRQLVGDGAVEVRRSAVTALRALNDGGAFEVLLTQLAQERDPETRALVAETLGPIRDVRAVPALTALLDDPSIRVAESGAAALAAMGTEIRRDDAAAERVAAALVSTLESRTQRDGGVIPGRDELRGACVDALAPLRRRDRLARLLELTGTAESPRVRRAALRALAELRDPAAAGALIAVLEGPAATAGTTRPSPGATTIPASRGGEEGAAELAGVRLEAVNALGSIPTFRYAGTLVRRLDPAVESDPLVRQRAWTALVGLLGDANRTQLVDLASRFTDRPDRRLTVLTALSSTLTAAGDEEELAAVRREIGICLLRLDRPADAAGWLRQSLEYFRSVSPADARATRLATETTAALLRARLYAQACDVAAGVISDAGARLATLAPSPSTAAPDSIASVLLDEADRLLDAEEASAAGQLLAEIARVKLPLDGPAAQRLAVAENRYRAVTRPATPPSAPPPPESRPATTTQPSTRP